MATTLYWPVLDDPCLHGVNTIVITWLCAPHNVKFVLMLWIQDPL
jgi:hypothetical protein